MHCLYRIIMKRGRHPLGGGLGNAGEGERGRGRRKERSHLTFLSWGGGDVNESVGGRRGSQLLVRGTGGGLIVRDRSFLTEVGRTFC